MKQPNILLFLPDQHRGDWLEYPQEILDYLGQSKLRLETPNIKKLMSRGTTFVNAYTPCPSCAPARACLASGMRYRQCRVLDNTINFDPTMDTFYRRLRDGGYCVGSVGKLDLNKANKWWSNTKQWNDSLKTIGFTHVIDSEGKGDGVTGYAFGDTPGPYMVALKEAGLADTHVKDIIGRAHNDIPTKLPDDYYGDNWVGQRGLDILRSFPENTPWFLQVNFPGPHNPWDVTKSMKEAFKDKTYPDPVGNGRRPANMNGIMQNYAAMIHNIDRNLGLFMEEIRRRGEESHTIIVYSSDHGEMMGDFGRFYKCRPEQGSVRIPMVIDASCCQGRRNFICKAPVELEDLAATFLDYAQIQSNTKWQARSLRPILAGNADQVRPYAVSEYIYTINRDTHIPHVGSWHMITDGHYKLTEFDNEISALYDLDRDPRELNNLAQKLPEQAAKLHQAFIDEVPQFYHYLAKADAAASKKY